MAELANSSYKRLFEVRLLHHYWLDQGAKAFDGLAADKQASLLLAYNARPFLSVAPTSSTQQKLNDMRCRFMSTQLGFVVAVPDGVVVAADTNFSFVVSVVDGSFFDYTALTFRPRTIYEAFDPSDHSADRVVYRYKENVPVLSNLTGATRVSGSDTLLFLSQDYPSASAGDQVEALINSGGALLQLTSDNPAATTQSLGTDVATFPAVYIHQGDAPPIAPPAGVIGAPARGLLLSADIPDDVFALITLTAVRGDNDAFSFVDGSGAAKTPAPIYQVRFKNRSTLWTYLDKQTGAITTPAPALFALTYFGNASSTNTKPSRGLVKAQQSGTRITQLVSEIYV